MGTTDFTEPLINGEQRRLASDSALVIPEAYAAVNPEGHDPRGTGVKRWAWGEIREQCWLSAPIMAMYMLQHMVWLSGNLFVGHLGAFPLAAVSLANSFSCITGYYVLIGLADALETLCGQAYGAKQYHMLGIYLQRAFLILAVAAMPISLVWLAMSQILLAVGEDAELAGAAQTYMMWLLPSLFGYVLLPPLIKFFQMQRAMYELLICSGVTVAVQIPLCWLFIDRLHFGFVGAAIAGNISLAVQLGCLWAFVCFSPKFEKTFPTMSREVFEDLGEFLWLAIPSATMACLGDWSFEILTLLAGLMPNSKLEISTFAISMALLALANIVAVALGVAASVRVSNELGAGKPNAARLSVAISMGIGLVNGLVMAILIILLRNVWGWTFCNEQEVVDRVASTAPYLAVLAFLYGCQAILSGVVRGIGWQRAGTFANLGAYYGVGLPLTFVFVFVFHFDTRGLLLGMGCGLVTQLVTLTVIILHTDWDILAKEALLRSNSYKSRLPITESPFLIKIHEDEKSPAVSDQQSASADVEQ